MDINDRKNILSQKLRRLRKEHGMTAKELAYELSFYGHELKERTIYNWENAKTQPTVDELICLCSIFNLSPILNEFGYKVNPSKDDLRYFELEEIELKLIEEFRKHPEHRNSVLKLYDLDNYI
ncbi:MAG: helix-turn-helix domain-containing protein [Lachnospiraceae bacterium]|nr:helix-turn-helix domain-containing protein [Lachnospiraceae bacterium]